MRPISQYGHRFLFTGREYLYTPGIYDYRHRHYHPGLGRFIQTDPIGFGGDPMNLYRYSGGNPINHSDPTGLLIANNDAWRRLMLWQDGGDGAVSEQLTDDKAKPKSVSAESEGPKVHIEKAGVHESWTDQNHSDSQPAKSVDDEHFGDHKGKVFGGVGRTTGHAFVREDGTVCPIIDTQYARFFAQKGVLKPFGPRWTALGKTGEPEHQREISADMGSERTQQRAERAFARGGILGLRREMGAAMSEAVNKSGLRHDNPINGDHYLRGVPYDQ